MNEEDLSAALFAEATAHAGIQVLSWQAIDGKGYFAADVKLRLKSGERMEPDLILATPTAVWLIEIKSQHSESLADEAKLLRLLNDVSPSSLLQQISLRSQVDVRNLRLHAAVAYVVEDVPPTATCQAVVHSCWETQTRLGRSGLEPLLEARDRRKKST